MKNKEKPKRLALFILSAAVYMSGISAMPVSAASSADRNTNSTGVNNALDNFDIIDESKTGSIKIYKYDQTSAQKDGVWASNGDGTVTITTGGNSYTVESTGESNPTAQSALADYAIKGVEFSYVYLGDVETYSYSNAGKTELNVVYEIDNDLAGILGLNTNDAYDMSAKGAAFKCNSGKLHYDSSQLSEALSSLMLSGDTAAKNKLEAYAQSHITGRFTDTDANGYTTLSGLELGLYLIVETQVPEEVTVTAAPWLVSLPFTNISDSEQSAQDEDNNTTGEFWIYDAVCYPKNQTGNPTVDKMVRNSYGTLNPTKGISGYNHGTSESVLEQGAGHLEGTSLPIGGSGTHSVITSHTGLSRARLFSDLVKLEEGDIFFLNILDQKLAYCVDQIKVVEPDDLEELLIKESKDYCTLVTCTPYGINSHRLLVRGARTGFEEDDKTFYTERKDSEPSVWMSEYRRALTISLSALGAGVLLLFVIRNFAAKS